MEQLSFLVIAIDDQEQHGPSAYSSSRHIRRRSETKKIAPFSLSPISLPL